MTVPPSLRRAGRILGWSLLGLVLVLFFALAGGMAFLRTQPRRALDRGYGCFRSEKCGY